MASRASPAAIRDHSLTATSAEPSGCRAATLQAFLIEAARYFERRQIGGEDSAYWANVLNAANCREAAHYMGVLADMLTPKDPPNDILRR